MIPVGYKLVNGVMTEMTIEEKIIAGIITEEQAPQIAIDDEIYYLREYLQQTDWYAIRFAETEVAVPSDILTARQDARDRISELEGE